jgi:hypothetical protein
MRKSLLRQRLATTDIVADTAADAAAAAEDGNIDIEERLRRAVDEAISAPSKDDNTLTSKNNTLLAAPALIDLSLLRVSLLHQLDLLDTCEAIHGSRRSAPPPLVPYSYEHATRPPCDDTEIHVKTRLYQRTQIAFDRQYNVFLCHGGLLHVAADAASRGDVYALDVLFTRHGRELLPYRLGILSRLPLTMDPNTYKSLLPKIVRIHA